jgi:thiol-disulfide isomerase/thioredoxin
MTNDTSQVIVATKKGCPACKKTRPALKKTKSQLEKKKKVRFVEIDADTNETLLDKLDVQALPEIMYKNKHGEIHKMPWDGTPKATNIVRWVDDVNSGKPVKAPSKPREPGCADCGLGGRGVSPKLWGPSLWR